MTGSQPALRLRVTARSDIGLVRKNNQDSGYASPRLLVVADGMGGAAAGDLASAVAIDTIKALDPLAAGAPAGSQPDPGASAVDPVAPPRSEPVELPPAPDLTGTGLHGVLDDIEDPALARLARAVIAANDRIADLVEADYNLEGMGTTFTGGTFDGRRLALAHIGDSRAYLLRDGLLRRLTHDHSWVQSLVDDGRISPAEAAYHPHRSLLLKVLNGQPANDPDLAMVELLAGDRLVLCSDGLCGLIDDEGIAAIAGNPDLEQTADHLVAAALAAGGIDNVTVVLADVLPAAQPAAPPPAAAAVRSPFSRKPPAPPSQSGPPGAGSTDATSADDPIILGAAADRQIPDPAELAALLELANAEHTQQLDPAQPDSEATDPAGMAAAAPRTAGAAEEEIRYAPRPPRKRRAFRTLIGITAILLVFAAGIGAALAWSRTQFYVGDYAGADGLQVAIYQGLPQTIGPLALSQVFEVQELPVASLPPFYQAEVSGGIEVADLAAARATVQQLRDAAERCATPTKPTPAPTQSGTAKASPGSSGTPAKSTTSAKSTPDKTAAEPTGGPSAKSSTAPQTSNSPAASGSATQLPGQEC